MGVVVVLVGWLAGWLAGWAVMRTSHFKDDQRDKKAC
jgi:uncharacterized membrane protein YeaQ/YmgE (transglycosylase-associated protein family)